MSDSRVIRLQNPDHRNSPKAVGFSGLGSVEGWGPRLIRDLVLWMWKGERGSITWEQGLGFRV